MNQVENYIGDVNYSGSDDDFSVDTVEGVYAHVILGYDAGNTFTTLDISNGYIGATVTDNVLITSEFYG